ncbi:MAG: LptF/LptG family permease [Candidatus Omnitrophica bacterium]|nr:LptF/LptG family permease [Candidatus Omnitrophota bacterium]
MRILDRYVLKSIAGIFIGTVICFAFLFILIDTFGSLQDFIEKKVPLTVIAQYYVSFLPMVIVNTSTMACLIAVLFTYSSLNGNNEIIAARASGMDFWHITRPALIFAALVCAFVFLVNERFVPQSSIANQEIREQQIKITVADKDKGRPPIKNLTFYGMKNRLFFVEAFDPNTNELSRVTIIGHDEHQNLREKIVALKGKWTGDIAWKFFNCQITEYNTNLPNVPGEVKIYQEKLMDIKETPKDFLRQRMDVTAMNIKQLSAYINRFSGSGAIKTINNLEVDLHQKIAFPFRTLVIVLAGLPFALQTGRRKAATFAAIGIAVIIGFLYYVLDAVGLALGKGGALEPLAAAWLAPAVFLTIAAIAIKKNF